MAADNEKKVILPHHVQQRLCTNRLPYRQGRKLTAIKVYTVNNESNHLLIFGVPSLNLRQETKSLFLKFGKLLQFNITTKYPTEQFTETYHAIYEKIQSARIAKRMLDTKNFYGGSLHICYAPELETIEETRQKLMQRQRDVIFRLVNLNKDNGKDPKGTESTIEDKNVQSIKKLNMGELNTISVGKQIRDVVFKNKRKRKPDVSIEKRFKPCFIPSKSGCSNTTSDNTNIRNDCKEVLVYKNKKKREASVVIEKGFQPNESGSSHNPVSDNSTNISNDCKEVPHIDINENNKSYHGDGRNISNDIKEMEGTSSRDAEIEFIDCTSVDAETITNINESLNYNNFGNEIIRKVAEKPVNRIKFNLVNKKL